MKIQGEMLRMVIVPARLKKMFYLLGSNAHQDWNPTAILVVCTVNDRHSHYSQMQLPCFKQPTVIARFLRPFLYTVNSYNSLLGSDTYCTGIIWTGSDKINHLDWSLHCLLGSLDNSALLLEFHIITVLPCWTHCVVPLRTNLQCILTILHAVFANSSHDNRRLMSLQVLLFLF